MACLGRSRQLRRPRSDMPTGAVERSGRAVDSTDAQGQQCVIAQSLGIALARLRDLDDPPRDDLLDDIGLPPDQSCCPRNRGHSTTAAAERAENVGTKSY